MVQRSTFIPRARHGRDAILSADLSICVCLVRRPVCAVSWARTLRLRKVASKILLKSKLMYINSVTTSVSEFPGTAELHSHRFCVLFNYLSNHRTVK